MKTPRPPKARKMRDWIAVHAIHRRGAGIHKQNTRREYDPRMELLDYEEPVCDEVMDLVATVDESFLTDLSLKISKIL